MRWKNRIVLALALLVVNLPALTDLYREHHLDSAGVTVSARLIQHRQLDSDRFLGFSVPDGVPRKGDPSFRGTARVDEAAYEEATRSGRVEVRVLPGSTSVWHVTGQVNTRLGLYLALGADALIALMVLLYLRFRSRLRPTLVLLAEGDLQPGPAEAVLDRIGGQLYVVCGEVQAAEGDVVALQVGDRRVRVMLDGHLNLVPTGQPARVTGTMVG